MKTKVRRILTNNNALEGGGDIAQNGVEASTSFHGVRGVRMSHEGDTSSKRASQRGRRKSHRQKTSDILSLKRRQGENNTLRLLWPLVTWHSMYSKKKKILSPLHLLHFSCLYSWSGLKRSTSNETPLSFKRRVSAKGGVAENKRKSKWHEDAGWKAAVTATPRQGVMGWQRSTGRMTRVSSTSSYCCWARGRGGQCLMGGEWPGERGRQTTAALDRGKESSQEEERQGMSGSKWLQRCQDEARRPTKPICHYPVVLYFGNALVVCFLARVFILNMKLASVLFCILFCILGIFLLCILNVCVFKCDV